MILSEQEAGYLLAALEDLGEQIDRAIASTGLDGWVPRVVLNQLAEMRTSVADAINHANGKHT